MRDPAIVAPFTSWCTAVAVRTRLSYLRTWGDCAAVQERADSVDPARGFGMRKSRRSGRFRLCDEPDKITAGQDGGLLLGLQAARMRDRCGAQRARRGAQLRPVRPGRCRLREERQGGRQLVFDDRTGHSSVYENTRLISSKALSAYDDFPMPRDYPAYPGHREVQAYFEAYPGTSASSSISGSTMRCGMSRVTRRGRGTCAMPTAAPRNIARRTTC